MRVVSVELNAEQVVILQFILNEVVNPKRAVDGEGFLTLDQFIVLEVDDRVKQREQHALQVINQDRAAKFSAVTDAVRDQVDALLGVKHLK